MAECTGTDRESTTATRFARTYARVPAIIWSRGVPALSFDESSFSAPAAFGAFRVLHQIGSGVLGPVFRTYEPQRDRLVAVKAFRLEIVPEDVARLADALRKLVASGLSDPAIVPAIDAGIEGSTAYLAMEYVAAETLDVALRHLAPSPIERALPILTGIAGAIDAAWAAGEGHGALHPRDVFIIPGTSEARVTGFGVIPALESLGVALKGGTVRRPYSAPERAAGEAWDARADVYSLGAIAHELLTGRRPAGPGEQDGALPTGTTPEQRVGIRRVLSAALAERPQHRFASGKAFADALAAVAKGEAVTLPEAVAEETIADPEVAAAVVVAPAVETRPEPSSSRTPLFAEMDGSREGEVAAEAKAEAVAHWEDESPAAAPEAPAAAAPPVERPRRRPRAERRPEAASAFADAAGAAASAFAPGASADRTADKPAPAPGTEHPTPDTRNPAPDADHPSPSASPLPIRPEPVWSPSVLSPVHEPPPEHLFPWGAFAAAVVASLIVGTVIGYQWPHPASSPSTVTGKTNPATGTRSGDTEVPVANPAPVAPVAPPKADVPGPASAKGAKATEPAATGRLVIKSTPAGATVTIDGKAHGKTPATVTGLSLGPHTLDLVRAGYVTRSERIALSVTSPSRDVSIELVPARPATPAAATGSIYADSRPAKAQVFVDGKLIGLTPLAVPELKPGAHTVRFVLTGHKPLTMTVTVKAGEQAQAKVSLEIQ